MGAATVMVRLDTLPQETVDKILEAAGSPVLPEATAADAGKVLVVDEDGEYALGEGGGTGGGAMVVNIDDDTGALNKTWQEIRDAMAAGQIVNIPTVSSEVEVYSGIVGTAFTSDDKYGLWALGADSGTDEPFAIAQTANDYPVIVD